MKGSLVKGAPYFKGEVVSGEVNVGDVAKKDCRLSGAARQVAPMQKTAGCLRNPPNP